MPLEILQIAPSIPPAINGLGDYAYLLAKQLRTAHDIDSRFLVCNLSQSFEGELDRFKVYQLEAKQDSQLARKLSMEEMPPIVLLHYVGYGYEKRGCPFWLLRGLESWKRGCKKRRLVIMFHELYAFGPPWRSSFWASPAQRWLAASLARLADHCVTNLGRYAKWLESQARKHLNMIETIPVFSNIGERSNIHPFNSRSPQMVIFGSARWVIELLGKYQNETLKCCHELGIQEIITIGCPAGTAPAKLPVPVTEFGFLSASKVAEIISSSKVGVMNYFPGYLAKSGVFAAYSALGALPVLPRFTYPNCDGCDEGKNYLFLDRISMKISDDTLQQVANSAWEWYQTHNLSRTADAYAGLLKNCGQSW